STATLDRVSPPVEGPWAQSWAHLGSHCVFPNTLDTGHPIPRSGSGAVPSHFAAASERLALCSLAKMRLMWFLTVFSLMKHVVASWRLVMPDAIRSMISAFLVLSRNAALPWAAGGTPVRPEDDCATPDCSRERFCAEAGDGVRGSP